MSDTTPATAGPRGGPPEEQSPLGPRIQAFRRRAGLSQEAAASRAGISTRALRDIERGRAHRPRPGTLRGLAEPLGLSGDELAHLLTAARSGPPRDTGRPRLLILGPLALRRGRTPVPVTGPMLRRLLGLLALKHPEPATQQEITDILWPSGPPRSHPSLIHTYVSQARRLLAPCGPRSAPQPTVARTPTGYRLEAPRNQIDLGHFDELLARAEPLHRTPDPETRYASLTEALRCWRGPVLADADPVLRRHPAAVAAEERRVRAALLHADTALLLGRSGEAVPVLADLVNAEPLHEGLHARLVLALAGSGEQAAALQVFTRLRVRLDEELGIEPGAEIREAHLRVLRRQLPGARRPDHRTATRSAPTQSAPTRSAPTQSAPTHYAPAHHRPAPGTPAPGTETRREPAHREPARPAGTHRTPAHPAPAHRTAAVGPTPAQLPAGVRMHVGRRPHVRVLDTLVATDPARRPHLAVLVGAPGVGKTALAMHWAHARREHFADGQLFVDLRGHSRLPALRPADVLAQFLRALGVPPHALPENSANPGNPGNSGNDDEAAALYRTLLADRRVLIVLDNARDAEQVRPLIPGAPGCAVVITSRSRLAGLVSADGARRIALDVLDPDEGCRLLGSIVGACNVAAEEEAARRLVELCGGLPLAIRIAGANLVARDTSIADHCAELAGDDILGRLRIEGDGRSTVRSAFELSYRTLPDEARRMFRLLGQLPGPDLTVGATAALAGLTPAASAALLARLADAHLVREKAGRFALDVLLRSYARELIGADEAHTARRRLLLSPARGPVRRGTGPDNCSGSYAGSAGSRA
ncbi:BTAD domain-containing putative transcriptional regulator [Streptomyces sp. NPDC057644]|uniref:BTAD domain-containing putative transcriptional regulator n=1 Tax=Streptomyces sp. NPDC057644 TaxID=3346191 RepID=UPI00368A4607